MLAQRTRFSMQQPQDFISLAEFCDLLEGQIHPVILSNENKDEYISHHGVGTAFVLEHGGELFVVSAQHVLNSQGATHEDLRIRLRNAPISVIFDRRAVFRDESDPDPDSDLVIMRIVRTQHEALFAAGLSCVRATDCITTEQIQDVEAFHIYGYPDEGRGYEYDEKSLTAVLWCVSGVLTEPALPGLATVRIVSERPAEFRGMSGSMVIAEKDGEWKFGGMVTLATNTKALLSFIPAEKIVHYLNKLLFMEQIDLILPEDFEITN
ncbi:hypothetical protein O999_03005 [Pseudomonas putida LF54]|nr:hypothetical protein O999_03005 [Pseudomonas putida LF54]